MDEGDADRRAEMPEDSRKVAGGTREKKEGERQASTAVKEKTQPGAKVLMEEVLRRENMLRALRRVRSNKGAPGVDGMTVEELVPYLRRIGHASERSC
jgi:retron-type reverse transcriptase